MEQSPIASEVNDFPRCSVLNLKQSADCEFSKSVTLYCTFGTSFRVETAETDPESRHVANCELEVIQAKRDVPAFPNPLCRYVGPVSKLTARKRC